MTAPASGPPPRPRRLLLHAGLFLCTVLTTTAAGAMEVHGRADLWGLQAIFPISDGLSYSLPLMAILLAHELGHYVVARLHGVDASLPYFIPLPPILFSLGTMGAVIGMQEVTKDRKKLIDIGAAGPLAGLLVAVPLMLYGLHHSPVNVVSGGEQEGNSVLYALLKHRVTGAWLPAGPRDVQLHPTAWAAWVGLLVTMINLIPVAQLDGGHIAVAYFGNGYGRFADRLHGLLPFGAAAVFFWVLHVTLGEAGARWSAATGVKVAAFAAMPWLLWYLMIRVVRAASGGVNHPPVDDRPLPPSRKLLFWLMVVVFAGVFMPVPFRAKLGDGTVARPPSSATVTVRR